jgi:hypothetical protein
MEPMAQKIKHLVALLYLAKSQFDFKLQNSPEPYRQTVAWSGRFVQNIDREESLHCSSDLLKSKPAGY